MRLLRQLSEITAEPVEHPYERSMVLDLQSRFIDDDWDTELKNESWLTKPEEFDQLKADNAKPDLSSYVVYPTIIEATKGNQLIRAYFIRTASPAWPGDKNLRIRICKQKTTGKSGYRDSVVAMGKDVDDVWQRFDSIFNKPANGWR